MSDNDDYIDDEYAEGMDDDYECDDYYLEQLNHKIEADDENENIEVDQNILSDEQQQQMQMEAQKADRFIVVAREIEDIVFEEILKDYSPDIEKVKECILNENDIEVCYLRIAKLLNYTLIQIEHVLSFGGWENNEETISNKIFDSLDLTSVLIDICLQFSSVFTCCNNAQLTNNYQIDITKDFTKSLAKFIQNYTLALAEASAEGDIFPCPLILSLKKFLVFCLNIPIPFVCEQSFSAIMGPLYEKMTLEPTAEGFELLTLLLFANPDKMHARLESENVFQSYLESSLKMFNDENKIKYNDCKCLASLAKLLLFNSTLNPKSQINIDKKQLESDLSMLINAQLNFSENDQKNLSTAIPELIESIFFLISDISKQNKSELSLLKNLPMRAWPRSLPWISIAILPTLNPNDLKFIFEYISRSWSFSEIKEAYTQLESASKDQRARIKWNNQKCLNSVLLNRRECLQVHAIVQLSIASYKPYDLRWNKIFSMQADDAEINEEQKERLHQAILRQNGVLFVLELTKEQAPSSIQSRYQSKETIKISVYLNGIQKKKDIEMQNNINQNGGKLEEYINDSSIDKTKFMSNKSNFYLRMEGPIMWYQQSDMEVSSLEAIEGVSKSTTIYQSLKYVVGRSDNQVYSSTFFKLKGDRLIFYNHNSKLMEINLGYSEEVVYHGGDGHEEMKQNDENILPPRKKVQWKRYSNDLLHGQMIPKGMKLNRIEVFEVSLLGENVQENIPIAEKVRLKQNHRWINLESDSEKEIRKTLKSLKKDQEQLLNLSYWSNQNLNRLKEQEENQKLIASLDVSVQDRFATQVGVLGLDSLSRQFESSVLIVGLNHIGVEIAKNIAMSGVKTLGLCEIAQSTKREFNSLGQFCMPFKENNFDRILESDLIDITVRMISDLNKYVKCEKESINDSFNQEVIKTAQKYTTVVLVNPPYSFGITMADACRKAGTACIVVEHASVYIRVINQFPSNFTVLDAIGIPTRDYMIGSIEQIEGEDFKGQVIIHLKKGQRHNLQVGSEIVFREVIEKSGNGFTSWNDKGFTVMDSMDQESFKIDVQDVVSAHGMPMASYLRNGIISERKIELKLNHEPYFNQLTQPTFDEQMSDDTDLEEKKILSLAFLTLSYGIERNQFMPEYSKQESAETFFLNFLKMFDHLITQKIIPKEYLNKETIDKYKSKILLFAITCKGYVPAQGSVVGGVVAQEVMKSITKKWKPIDQTWIYNCEELLEKNPTSIIQFKLYQRLSPLQMIVGNIGMKRIASANTFVVGAGAIGGEIIKNLAMNGFSIDGSAKITVTDPEKIKNQNLSRSFLFREKLIGQSKSNVSVASAILMNHDLLDHIEAKEQILYQESENEFSDDFFQKQNIVLSALDNLAARQYVKARCVKLRVKMVDSGTLGPKGRVQVVVPSEGNFEVDQIDVLEGEQGNEIIVDQLKMFPENNLDCLEWAQEKFGQMFKEKYSSFQLLLEGLSADTYASLEEEVIREALVCWRKIPRSFNDCLEYAVKKFHKFFYLNVKQMLQVYPLEHKLADGSHFWTLPKRSPVPLAFTPENNTYSAFVIALAKIRANNFGIPYFNDKDFDIKELRKLMESKKILEFQSKDVVIKNKANNVQDQLQQDAVQTDQIEETQGKDPDAMHQEKEMKMETGNSKEKLLEEVLTLKRQHPLPLNILLQMQQFESDNEDNFHLDFLHAMTNCRGESFRLEPIDRIDVKIKVGKITPELITTTAIVAGLQTIEAMKILLGREIGTLKNSLVNVSTLPMAQTSPIQAHSN